MSQVVESDPNPSAVGNVDVAVDTQPEVPAADPTCKRCGTFEEWGMASWCPVCGYYPSFDEEPEEIDYSLQADPNEHPVHDHWWQMIPVWGRILAAGIIVVLVAAIGIRYHFHVNGGNRALFSAGMWLVGFLTAFGAHALAGFEAMKRNSQTAPADIFVNPMSIWGYTSAQLPKTKKRYWCFAWGSTAMFSALVIIGGIPISVLWGDWGFIQPETEQSPLAAIAQAGQKGGGMSLEEIAGQLEKAKPVTVAPYATCVAYGYLPDGAGGIDRVLLATNVGGDMKHVATASHHEIKEDVRQKLLVMMEERKTDKPLLPSHLNAQWVIPLVLCDVQYSEWNSANRLMNPYVIDASTVKDFKDLESDLGDKADVAAAQTAANKRAAALLGSGGGSDEDDQAKIFDEVSRQLQ